MVVGHLMRGWGSGLGHGHTFRYSLGDVGDILPSGALIGRRGGGDWLASDRHAGQLAGTGPASGGWVWPRPLQVLSGLFLALPASVMKA